MLLLREVNELVIDWTCRKVSARPGSGLIVDFYPDEDPRTDTQPEQHGTSNQPSGRNTLSVYCSWLVLQDEAEMDGWESAKLLVDKRVQSMQFANKMLDFELRFSERISLRVATDPSMLSFNYIFRFSTLYWSVGPNGEVQERIATDRYEDLR